MPAVYAIGDIHGQYDKMVALLNRAGLIDKAGRWTGGDAHLWFIGDFFDRGPQGLETVELVMRLQNQAADAGGSVQAVLGNHDMLILSVYRFSTSRELVASAPRTFSPETFPAEWVDMWMADWLRNGGVPGDLARLTAKHAAWLSHLPALARVGDTLLLHADSGMYTHYGDTIEEINAFFRHLLARGSADEWERVLDAFSEHRAFISPGGPQQAIQFLRMFGCARMVHGHTPLQKFPDHDPAKPLVYADGRCINIDGGLYLGGPGFIYQIV